MEYLFKLVFSYQVVLLVLVVILLKSSIKFVPQNRAYIISRFGKYNTTLEAGWRGQPKSHNPVKPLFVS